MLPYSCQIAYLSNCEGHLTANILKDLTMITTNPELQIGGIGTSKLLTNKEGYVVAQLTGLEFLKGDSKEVKRQKRAAGLLPRGNRLEFTFECRLEEPFLGEDYQEIYLWTNATVDAIQRDRKRPDGSTYKSFSDLTQLYINLGYADRKVLERDENFLIPVQNLNNLDEQFFAFKVELVKGRFWNPILSTVRLATSTERAEVAEYFPEDYND